MNKIRVRGKGASAIKASARGPAVHLPPRSSLGYLVRETYRAFQRELQPHIGRFGITSGMWWFLRALWEKDGISQTELSQNVKVMGPTTVRAVEQMENRGLIERRREGSDSRKVFIYLTEEGRALRDVLIPAAVAVLEKATRRLSAKEADTLRQLLSRILETLDEGDH